MAHLESLINRIACRWTVAGNYNAASRLTLKPSQAANPTVTEHYSASGSRGLKETLQLQQMECSFTHLSSEISACVIQTHELKPH